MNIKEKIIQTLHDAKHGLEQLQDDFYIFGSAASILSDVKIPNTEDIDILTTKSDAKRLEKIWKAYKLQLADKESPLFRSVLSRYRFPLMDIEITGGLEVCKEGEWKALIIYDYKTYPIDDLLINIPTLNEQKNILHFFGRDKDLSKIKLIDERLKEFN